MRFDRVTLSAFLFVVAVGASLLSPWSSSVEVSLGADGARVAVSTSSGGVGAPGGVGGVLAAGGMVVGRSRFVPTPPPRCPNAVNTPGGDDGMGGCWPYAGNTGIPAGTTLTDYAGSCEIHADDVVIDSKTVNCGGMLVYGSGVIIRNSKLNTSINTNAPGATILIEDSEIDAQNFHIAAVGIENVTIRRSNVYGGQHGVQCYGNCTVEDNWLHDTWPGGKDLDWHENGFISNGGSAMALSHNSLFCTGGCTADVALLPDDNLDSITVARNLFVASPDSAYCFYGGGTDGAKPGTATNIVVTDNVWQRGANNQCATFGPVTYMDMGQAGNVWTNNKWADGAVLDPVF